MLCLLAGVVVTLTGCTGSMSAAYTTQTTSTQPSAAVDPATEDGFEPITIGGAGFVVHAGGPVDQRGFDASWAAVLDTLNRYLDAAVLTPLRSGGPAGDLTPLFSALSVGRVTTVGPDRAAFIDEGLPPAADLRRERGVATLTGLGGRDAVLSVVSAQLDLRLTGQVNGAPFTVVRTGELVLILDGPTWRIDAWDLRVTRSLAGMATTTTVRT